MTTPEPRPSRALPENFNDIVLAATAAKDESALSAIYEHVFKLPVWHFLADAEMPDKPQLGSVDGEISLLIFTDQAELVACAKALDYEDEDGSCHMFSVRVPDAVPYIAKLGGFGVEQAVFNFRSDAAPFPLRVADAQVIYDRVGSD
jgi:hypothetical protein